MATTSVLPQLQPQLAQLELRFNAPLIKDSQVLTFANLLSLNFNYDHKIVWVKDEKINYYLDSGDGTSATHWKRLGSTALIETYTNKSYQESTVVYYGTSLYVAKQYVPINTDPIGYPLYWQEIYGKVFPQRYYYQNLSSWIFYSSSTDPTVEINIGTYQFDGGGDIVLGADNFPDLIDVEKVDAPLRKRSDLAPNNGDAYEILFYEESILSEQSGYIVVK